MMVSPILAVSFFMNLVAVAFVVCAVVLMLIILAQKGKGGGLSAAFGGGPASGLLGSKTGDFLTWLTIALVGVFLMLAVVMAKFYKPTIGDYGTGQPQQTQQAPPQRPPVQQPPVRQERPLSSEPPLNTVETDDESTDANSL